MITENKEIYHIFTDGSCINIGTNEAKVAGICCIENIHDDISEKSEGVQTNNRAELTAIIRAYKIIDKLEKDNALYYIYSDSDYSIVY